ncbi:MAG: gliding motility-associated C-terminal domain-containing protein [Saprospiraceae bacterium]
MIKKITFLIIAFLISNNLLFSQADTDFWFVAPEVDVSHGDDPIFLRLTTDNQAATVTISQPANLGGISITQTIGAGTTNSINLTAFKAIVENQPANTILNYGIHIQSTTPITAYYEVANNLNPEIFPLKGSSALGQFFYLPGQDDYANQVGTPAFDIVATENNTTVTITPSDPIVGHAANIPFTITLNAGETFSCVGTNTGATATLAGSKITSDKPIAVTHSDDSLFNNGAWDLIGDQIVPVDILGTEYIAIKGWATDERVYIVATENNTTFYLNGNTTSPININAGQLLSYPISGNAMYINSDKPIYVMHLSGHGTEMGDALLPPIECTGSDKIGFVRTGSGTLTVLVATTVGNEGNFLVNGNGTTLQAAAFFPIPGNPNWVGARLDLSVTQAPVGNNTIENTSGLFHLGILNEVGLSSEYGYFSSYSSLELGSDKTVCADDTPVQLDGGSGGSSYLWNDGSTNRYLNVTQSGEYHVESVIYNCTLYDTIQVNVLTPQVNLGNDTAICQGQTVTIDVTQPLITYLWNDGSTNPTYTTGLEETVFVEITDTFGCTASDTMEVVYPIADLEGDTTICQGDTLLLFSNVQPQFATSYTWNTGATGSSILITQAGQYWVDIIAEAGCISTDTVLIQFDAPPTITITTDTLLCTDEIVDISATIPNMQSILWSNGSTDTTQTISTEGIYIATLTDSIFCNVQDSVFVGFHPESFVELGNDTVICDGEPIILIPIVSSIGSFLWNDGSTESSLEVTIDGTYFVSILDENDCPADDSVFVDVLESLQPNLPTDTTICEDVILVLNAYQPNVETYLWSGESAFYDQNEITDTTFLITYAGTYSVETTNQCGGLTQYIEVTKEDCTCTPFIPNGFTPNEDGRNDNFQVYANCEVQTFRMEIYDRWGSLLFATDNPLNGWDGTSNGREVSSGVYVYRIEYTSADKNGNLTTSVKHGSVTLVR